jgi:hypothetical protein
VLKVEREEANSAGDGRRRRLPPEAAGNHQMKNEKQLALRLEHDAFAQRRRPTIARPSIADSGGATDRSRNGTGEAYAHHAFPDDARFQRAQVEEDVRQFGHRLEKKTVSIFRDWLEN